MGGVLCEVVSAGGCGPTLPGGVGGVCACAGEGAESVADRVAAAAVGAGCLRAGSGVAGRAAAGEVAEKSTKSALVAASRARGTGVSGSTHTATGRAAAKQVAGLIRHAGQWRITC